MKVGIYTSGLGQSFQEESVVKYATRLKNEMSYNKTGVSFELKTEKISYADKKESSVVSILENNETGQQTIYKLYEFKYNNILTERYNNYNILVKSLFLFILVVKKFPLLLIRMFVPRSFNRPYQTTYLFFLFFIIAFAILFMIPAGLGMLTNFADTSVFKSFIVLVKQVLPFTAHWHIDHAHLGEIAKYFVSITALLLIVVPQAKVIITALATEFVCANYYIELGAQSQEILGNLDQLVEYIAEKERGVKIHYHAYSFGSLVIIDYLFPFGNVPSKNAQELSEALITIGTPVEFVKAYYTDFYRDRNRTLEKNICWLNVYSIADALATNFRNDAKVGDAMFGISKDSLKPFNLNYEVTTLKKIGLFDFIFLYSIKAHGVYWDSATEGLSCLRIINNEINSRGLM